MQLDNFGCLANTLKVASGHYVDLAAPDPASIDISSIAAALSKLCRFGGHCPRFYSVAEHSVRAMWLANSEGVNSGGTLLAVLLHDATEAYVGDVIKPLKKLLPGYHAIEQRMESAIGKGFGINFEEFEETIKRFDRAMLKAEKLAMWPEDKEQWEGFSEIEVADVHFEFWSPADAEANFLSAYALCLNGQAEGIEMDAAARAYEAGRGVSEWDSFLTLGESRRLVELAASGFGTLSREPARLKAVKGQISAIEAKTD